MDNIRIPTANQCLEHPELGPLASLETAIDAACRALLAGRQWPGLEQEWIPPWRLPQTPQEWLTYWITAASAELHEAISAYRHSLPQSAQLRLLPEHEGDPDRPS